MDNPGEVQKLQHHLSLLREEYVRLQRDLSEVSRKYAVLSAECGRGIEGSGGGGYVSSLVSTVSALFNSNKFSDIVVKLGDEQFAGHRLVFEARGDHWGVPSVSDVHQLDWSDVEYDVAMEVLQWMYTDQARLSQGDDFVLAVMRAADRFRLSHLKTKCENALMSSVNVKNCIKFYATAEDIGASTLKEYCSRLVSTHWNDFTSEDFVHMKAALVYDMIKSKTRFPLHSAIRLRREDVVFLFLIEFNSQLPDRLNEADDSGSLPLDMALHLDQPAVCETLLKHRVNTNATDKHGQSLLHKAILREDERSAVYLVDHGARVDCVLPVCLDTPLHLLARGLAVEEWRGRVAKRLTLAGADVNAQNSDQATVLHCSVVSGCLPVFDAVLSCPCDLELRDNRGHTALWHSLLAGVQQNSMAQRLVNAGASVDAVDPATKDSLLHLAALRDLEDEAIFLVKSKAKTAVANQLGETPLHVAAAHGLPRLTVELLRAGANPNSATWKQLDAAPDQRSAGDVTPLYRQTPLHLAVQYRHRQVLTAILDHRQRLQQSADEDTTVDTLVLPNLNLTDSRDKTPLSLALDLGLSDMALELITAGASLNSTDSEGYTLLHRSIQAGNPESAAFLMKHGANINVRTPDGESLLQLSISAGLLDVTERLCQLGADMSPAAGQLPPLWQALTSSTPQIAAVLVRYGADTDCWSEGPDGCYQTLLHRAIDENNSEIAQFLIRSGCDAVSARRPGPDGRGGDEARDLMSPLHLCAQWGLEETLQTLLEHRVPVNARDCDQKTALHLAIDNGHAAITSLLLSVPDADLTARDKLGRSPFTLAMTRKNNRAAQAILDREPGVAEQYDSRGRNFLHVAIEKKDIESVMFLLSIHVNVHSRTRDALNLTPLHLAARADSEIILRNLMLAGASVDDRTPLKQTALHLAAERDCVQCISVLLDKAVDFNALDTNMDNALHVACKEGHLASVRVLLSECEIKAEAVNLRGRTPLHVLAAVERDNAAAICQLFVETMPQYPISAQDADGNTVLLLAYIRGSVNLCMVLVKAGAALGTVNNDGVSIFNFEVATKQLLFRLLDALSQEPAWSDGEFCMECSTKFGIATRKHHCRHCGRLLCNKCSDRQIPIVKYNINKPIRICDVCYDVLTLGAAMYG